MSTTTCPEDGAYHAHRHQHRPGDDERPVTGRRRRCIGRDDPRRQWRPWHVGHEDLLALAVLVQIVGRGEQRVLSVLGHDRGDLDLLDDPVVERSGTGDGDDADHLVRRELHGCIGEGTVQSCSQQHETDEGIEAQNERSPGSKHRRASEAPDAATREVPLRHRRSEVDQRLRRFVAHRQGRQGHCAHGPLLVLAHRIVPFDSVVSDQGGRSPSRKPTLLMAAEGIAQPTLRQFALRHLEIIARENPDRRSRRPGDRSTHRSYWAHGIPGQQASQAKAQTGQGAEV